MVHSPESTRVGLYFVKEGKLNLKCCQQRWCEIDQYIEDRMAFAVPVLYRYLAPKGAISPESITAIMRFCLNNMNPLEQLAPPTY